LDKIDSTIWNSLWIDRDSKFYDVVDILYIGRNDFIKDKFKEELAVQKRKENGQTECEIQ
jgi:hypothetical protein